MDAKFYISADRAKMDVDFVHDYLSNKSYWAKGRSKKSVLESIQNSKCFGVFDESNKQIGFARLVTDYVVFAWLMDVFVDESYQKKGIGKMLLSFIFSHPDLQKIKGIGLRTNDAHDLYRLFGFESIPVPKTWMLRNSR